MAGKAAGEFCLARAGGAGDADEERTHDTLWYFASRTEKNFVTDRPLLHNLYVSLPVANFHELYEKYSREVYRFALYLSGDATRAEDLTAEAFLRMWATPAPTHLATAKSYLLAIVRNLHCAAWRIERREAPLAEHPARQEALERVLDRKAELSRVLAALQALDAVERAAVLLRGEHQMPYEEIARVLEITPVAARVKVHRARKQLMESREGKTKP